MSGFGECLNKVRALVDRRREPCVIGAPERGFEFLVESSSRDIAPSKPAMRSSATFWE